jgi:hypothetical protein
MKTYEIKGRVVNAETGKPVGGIQISYTGHGKDGGVFWPPPRQETRSNVEGEFQFQGLLPGRYKVYPIIGRASEYFGDPALCEITDGAVDGVEIKLGTGGSISGTVIIDGTNDSLPDSQGKAITNTHKEPCQNSTRRRLRRSGSPGER